MWPYHYTGDLCGRIITLRGEVCVAHNYTKKGGLCGRIITLRVEVCVAALSGEVCVAVSLHSRGKVCVAASHYTKRFVWGHYIKRGGLCGRVITLRGEVCVLYHYTKIGGLCGRINTLSGEFLCGRIFKLRGEVCVAVSLQ